MTNPIEPINTARVLADALSAGAILERATLWPWVVTAQYLRPRNPEKPAENNMQRLILIVQSTVLKWPEASDYLPEGSTLLTQSTFPATRFDDMALHTRLHYLPHYAAFLLWRGAVALGKKPEDLVPHVDFDPVMLDADVQEWARPGSNPLGD